jgi:cobalt ECF transporter T component CbiQ
MASEDTATADGLLQRLDPRLKLVATLALLVVVGLVHHVPVLLAAYAVTLLLAAASAVPVAAFVTRVWLFVPVFTGIVVLPATLSVVNPGDVTVALWQWHGHAEGLTSQGLTSAALVVSRVATSVSLVVLLTVTTPWTRLLAALRAVGVPRMFVLVIGMAYRYVFLLHGAVTDMYEARRARTVSAVRHDAGARAFLGSSAGAMVAKAHSLSEEVHLAMVARGFRGDARTVQPLTLIRRDALAAAAVLGLAVAIYAGDVLLGR